MAPIPPPAQPLLTITENYVGFTRLDTLPERFMVAFNATLAIRMGEAAESIIDDAMRQLVPGHGYDTGLLHDSLTKKLVEITDGAFYMIYSDEADYWRYVEFGHMLANGDWWEGYHYIANAVDMNRRLVWDKARDAFREAAEITRAGSGAGISLSDVGKNLGTHL